MPRAASAATKPLVGALRERRIRAATAGSRRVAVTIGSASGPPGRGESPSRETPPGASGPCRRKRRVSVCADMGKCGEGGHDGNRRAKGDQGAKAGGRERAQGAYGCAGRGVRAGVRARGRLRRHLAVRDSRFSRNRRGQRAQPDDAGQVRKDLQGVHQITPRPDEIHLRDRAEWNEEAINPAIRQDDPRSEPVFEELLPVIGPADERARSRREKRRTRQIAAESRHGGVESEADGRRAGRPLRDRRRPVDHARQHDRQRGQRARAERNDDDFADRVQALLHGTRALRCAVSHPGGAIPGFVRIETAREAVADRREDPEPQHGVRGERFTEHHPSTLGMRPANATMTTMLPTR